MYDKPIEKVGSDKRLYLIEEERVAPNMIELSLIVAKKQLRVEDYLHYNVDIRAELVEQYMQSIKDQYEPKRHMLHKIRRELHAATINNHFDYLQLLHRVRPLLEELMQ